MTRFKVIIFALVFMGAYVQAASDSMFFLQPAPIGGSGYSTLVVYYNYTAVNVTNTNIQIQIGPESESTSSNGDAGFYITETPQSPRIAYLGPGESTTFQYVAYASGQSYAVGLTNWSTSYSAQLAFLWYADNDNSAKWTHNIDQIAISASGMALPTSSGGSPTQVYGGTHTKTIMVGAMTGSPKTDQPTASTPKANNSSCSRTPGDVKANMGSVDVQISLGYDAQSGDSAQLLLQSEAISDSMFTPNFLMQSGPVSRVTSNSKAVQFISPTTVANVVDVNATDRYYELQLFHRDRSLALDGNGKYTVPANTLPHTVIKVENPGNTGSADLKITRVHDSVSEVSEYWWNSVTNAFTMQIPSENRTESLSKTFVAPLNQTVESHSIMQGTVLQSKVETATQNFPFGDRVVRESVDPDGRNLTTTFSYYENQAADGGAYSLLKSQTDPTGYWQYFVYDSVGRVVATYSQKLNSTLTGIPTEAGNYVTYTLYSPEAGQPAAPGLLITTIVKDDGVEIGRSYRLGLADGYNDIICTRPNALWNDSTNLVTTYKYVTSGPFKDQLLKVTRPNNTTTLYSYTMKDGTGANTSIADNAVRWGTTISTGKADSTGNSIVNGTSITTYHNRAGHEIESITTDIATSLTTDHSLALVQDDFGRATSTQDVLSGKTVQAAYDCCSLTSTVDGHGVVTSYGKTTNSTYQTSQGVTTTVTRQGLSIIESRTGTDNTTVETSRTTLNVAGETVSSSKGGLAMATESRTSAGGMFLHTTVYADGGTRIEESYPDGTIRSITGSAVEPVLYESGVSSIAAGGVLINSTWEKETALTAAGATTSEWKKTWTDMAGRVWKVENSAGASRQVFFNGLGQIVRLTEAGGVTKLFAYNELGDLTVTAIDADQDGIIDYAGNDRIVSTLKSYDTRAGVVVEKTLTKIWQTASVDNATVVKTVERSVDGLQNWVTKDGTLIQTLEQPDAGGWNGNWTTTLIWPDGSSTVEAFTNDRLTLRSIRDSANTLVTQHSFEYDVHGRLWKTLQGSQLREVRHYLQGANPVSGGDPVSSDLLASFDVPAADGNGGMVTTTFSYDACGRQNGIVDALNGTRQVSFYPTGKPQTISGTREYPLSHTFTAQGRLATLTTSSDAGQSVTSWEYDPASGLPSAKKINGNTVQSYQWDLTGKLTSITGARGISATYTYDNFGAPTDVVYSDATPDVHSDYNRIGQVVSIDNGLMHNLMTNDANGHVTNEVWSGGLIDGISIVRGYDAVQHPSSFSVLRNGTALTSSSRTYDAASRLQTVTSSNLSATFQYAPTGQRISDVTFKRNGAVYASGHLDFNALGILTQLEYRDGNNAVIASSAYTLDPINRRTKVVREDQKTWDWTYNDRNEIQSATQKFADAAVVPPNQLQYTYDDVGNLLTSSRATRTTSYTVNGYNQSPTRTNPRTAVVSGEAASNAKVSINFVEAGRHGSYFWGEVTSSVTGSSYIPATIYSTAQQFGSPDVVAKEDMVLYVPPAQQALAYDGDGNLTSDGRWTYVWDGANRLISMEEASNSSLTSSGLKRKRLEFGYDPYGRRSSKKVLLWDDASAAWGIDSLSVFVWDGWNLVAELAGASAETITFRRGYVFGQSPQGAGAPSKGIGEILFQQSVAGGQSKWTTPLFDGNGNVLAAFDATSQSVTAKFDYDSYGNLLFAGGADVDSHPIRFSSRYEDHETGLIYYGYRYYNPAFGRWLSPDPLAEAGGVNVYSFVNNNPVNLVDPFGLTACLCACSDKTPDGTAAVNALFEGVFNDYEKYYKDKAPYLRSNSSLKTELVRELITEGKFLETGIEVKMKPKAEPCNRGILKPSTSLIKLCGQCVGLDKLGHFVEEGLLYYDIAHVKKKGVAIAKRFGLWTEGIVPENLTAAEYDFFVNPNMEMYFAAKPTIKLPPPLMDTFGALGDRGIDDNGDYSPADIAANESGLTFWQDVMSWNGNPPKKFNICKYVNESWDHVLHPNDESMPAPSRPLK